MASARDPRKNKNKNPDPPQPSLLEEEKRLSKYRYDREMLARKHEEQVIALQIQQFEELHKLASLNEDWDMVSYYDRLIQSRKNLYNR